MWHLYEIAISNSRMWLKIQASCSSSEQSAAFLESRFNGTDYILDEHRPVTPFRLSQRSHHIANWASIVDRLPVRWDDDEFHIVGTPYPWCATLSDDCDCHGSDGRLDAAYCSDLGLHEDTTRRASPSQNIRHREHLQQMRRALVNRQSASRANTNAVIEPLAEPSEQERFYCQVEGRYHAYSEQVQQRTAATVAATRLSLADQSEESRRVAMSNIPGLTAHWLRTFQFQSVRIGW